MSLNVFHCYSLVRPKVHNGDISPSQFSPQKFILRADNKTFLFFCMFENAFIHILKLMSTLQLLHFFRFIKDQLKLFSKNWKLLDRAISDFDSEFSWDQWLQPVFYVNAFLNKLYQKVAIKNKRVWRVVGSIDTEETYDFRYLLIVHLFLLYSLQ